MYNVLGGNGRSAPGKGHFSSPTSYLIDIITVSTTPQYLNESFLHQKYVVEDLSAKKIAAEVGCGLTAIKHYLKKYGITKGGPGAAKHKDKLAYGKKLVKGQLKSHCRESDTIESIKAMYSEQGHTPTAIARILNAMKVPTKKRGKNWDHSVIIDILKREGLYRVTRKPPKPREE